MTIISNAINYFSSVMSEFWDFALDNEVVMIMLVTGAVITGVALFFAIFTTLVTGGKSIKRKNDKGGD